VDYSFYNDFGMEKFQAISKGISGVFAADSPTWNYVACTSGILSLRMATFPIASD
jgi:hypothetical protein